MYPETSQINGDANGDIVADTVKILGSAPEYDEEDNDAFDVDSNDDIDVDVDVDVDIDDED